MEIDIDNTKQNKNILQFTLNFQHNTYILENNFSR